MLLVVLIVWLEIGSFVRWFVVQISIGRRGVLGLGRFWCRRGDGGDWGRERGVVGFWVASLSFACFFFCFFSRQACVECLGCQGLRVVGVASETVWFFSSFSVQILSSVLRGLCVRVKGNFAWEDALSGYFSVGKVI